jgi:hypothetical protein
MWLITPRGFYSVVAKPSDEGAALTIRARSERDIRNLADLIPGTPVRDAGTDYYRWRLRCTRTQWESAVAAMAREIDYGNFKSRIAGEDPARAALLADVWDTLYAIQETKT